MIKKEEGKKDIQRVGATSAFLHNVLPSVSMHFSSKYEILYLNIRNLLDMWTREMVNTNILLHFKYADHIHILNQ